MPFVSLADFEILGDPQKAEAIRLQAQRYRDYRIAPHRTLHIRDASLVGPHLLCLKGDELLEESIRGQRSFQRTPYLQEIAPRRYRLDETVTRRRVDGEVVAVGGKVASSFFHWIVEILPRLFILRDTPALTGIPVAMRPAKLRFQTESLEMLGIAPHFFSEEVVSADGVWLPSHMVLSRGQGQMSPEIVEICRRLALETVGAPGAGAGRRLYVSRSDADKRKVANEAEVRTLLERYGFETLLASKHGLADQIRLFSEAEYVVGPHGGGLASLAFCRPGARVIEFYAEDFVAVSPFWNISSLGGLRYRMLLCAAPPNDRGEVHHADMTVDLDALERCLSADL